jgi:hypothetical protein
MQDDTISWHVNTNTLQQRARSKGWATAGSQMLEKRLPENEIIANMEFKGGSFVEGLAVRLRDPRSGCGEGCALNVGVEAPTYQKGKCFAAWPKPCP